MAETLVGLVAGLLFLPGLAGAATAIAYFAGWPSQKGSLQLVLGMLVGVVAWFLVSFVFLRGFGRPEGADGGAYEQLCVRLRSLQARVRPPDEGILSQDTDRGRAAEAYRLAHAHTQRLEEMILRPKRNGGQQQGSREFASGFRWWFAFGYVNLWRDVHRAEEALLEVEHPDDLYIVALEDAERLRHASIEGREKLMLELRRLLEARKTYEANRGASKLKPCHGRRHERVDPLELPAARALVRAVRHRLNQRRNELWDRLVHLRILVLYSMIATGIVAYALFALAVIQEVEEESVTGGITFYLVGAVVGLFGELYATARRRRGIVDDYGLSTARLLTVPLVAGIAAVGGVVITRLSGTATAEGLPPLQDIFSLTEYPFGLVIAAIFGLTPGLLLDRLSQQTEVYKKELAQTGTGAESQELPED
jgi:hypothetical protein